MSDRERIAAVEAENAELKARIAVLEAKVSPKPRPQAPIEEGVRVTVLEPFAGGDLPTPAQFEGVAGNCRPIASNRAGVETESVGFGGERSAAIHDRVHAELSADR